MKTFSHPRHRALPVLFGLLLSLPHPAATASAQTTAEVCRETKRVLDEYQRNYYTTDVMIEIKNYPSSWERLLGDLNRHVTEGSMPSDFQTYENWRAHGIISPEAIEAPDVARVVRDRLVELMRDARTSGFNALKDQNARNRVQIDLRQQRMAALHCDEVLARARSSGSTALGRTWSEEESGWTSTWTREGDSDVFVATYAGPAGERATTRNSVSLNGDQVTISRLSSTEGHTCTYTGTLSGTSITGTYECPGTWSGTRPWTATITSTR